MTFKRLFLIDFSGALISTFMLGVLIPKFNHFIGMPISILYPLAFTAFIFAIYSGFCFLKIKKNWKPFLTIIAICNLIYCCITLILVIQQHEQLSILGFIYFIIEMIIITALVILEYKTINNNTYL